MTNADYKKLNCYITMAIGDFTIGFYNPSDELLKHKHSLDDIKQTVANLNKNSDIIFSLQFKKQGDSSTPPV